jgi:hypothetical protein
MIQTDYFGPVFSFFFLSVGIISERRTSKWLGERLHEQQQQLYEHLEDSSAPPGKVNPRITGE